MNPEITPSMLELFDDEYREEARRLMQKHGDDSRMAFLISELSSGKPNYLDLFSRGFIILPSPREAGGSPLAFAYFSLLSQIKCLPEEAKNFALHATAYSGGAYEHDPSYYEFGIDDRRIFKETVWPILSEWQH